MFLTVIDNVIISGTTGDYQVGSNIELPVMLERFIIQADGTIAVDPVNVSKTNAQILQGIEDAQVLQEKVAFDGGLESALIVKLNSLYTEMCKRIVGKKHLTDTAYDLLVKSYNIKYENATNAVTMPQQAAAYSMTATAFNTYVIAKHDEYTNNIALAFDLLETKRNDITTLLLTSDYTGYYSAVADLDTLPEYFIENVAVIL